MNEELERQRRRERRFVEVRRRGQQLEDAKLPGRVLTDATRPRTPATLVDTLDREPFGELGDGEGLGGHPASGGRHGRKIRKARAVRDPDILAGIRPPVCPDSGHETAHPDGHGC